MFVAFSDKPDVPPGKRTQSHSTYTTTTTNNTNAN
ncbi:hypothetical protein GGR92_003797 [Spirosoma lacussanchae]